MNKIKLKSKRKNRLSFFIISIFIILITSFILVIKLGKKINTSLVKISEVESKRITKLLLNKSVSDYISNNTDSTDMFAIEKNSRGDIQMVDLNSKSINEFLNNINIIVNKHLKELENGESSILDLHSDLITNSNIISNKKGIIFQIPIGLITQNSFLSNFGPKIPIKILINGDLETEIRTSIDNYGINNVLFKVFLNMKVSEQIIMPLYSKEFKTENNILIAAKMIQGEIPSYYFNDLNKNYTT